MEPMPPPRYDTPAPQMPTTRGIVAAYLLLFGVFLTMWALSEPLLAGLLAAGAVGAIVAIVGLLAAISALRRGERTRVYIPRTRVCVEF